MKIQPSNFQLRFEKYPALDHVNQYTISTFNHSTFTLKHHLRFHLNPWTTFWVLVGKKQRTVSREINWTLLDTWDKITSELDRCQDVSYHCPVIYYNTNVINGLCRDFRVVISFSTTQRALQVTVWIHSFTLTFTPLPAAQHTHSHTADVASGAICCWISCWRTFQHLECRGWVTLWFSPYIAGQAI